ncbi:hypothetical protein [Methylotuvimicrobium sp. KM2]|uniref:hypothetical protein n=1 Tax=Methylotuvimicrobium sp. KM2 TaxID=3133976 RepID=UPI003100B5E6
MNNPKKQLSNPFSTGGGGAHFEAHVQATFVTLMLTGGHAPCLPCWPISEVKLQGKIDGFDTDDLIVFVENAGTRETQKLLGQVKHAVSFVKSDKQLKDVINAAWSDFNNPRIFNKNKDAIALITGPLTAKDFQTVPWILEQAKRTASVDEFFRNVKHTNFSPSGSSDKLEVIRHHLKSANRNRDVADDQLYAFLRHFHWLGYDLGKEEGVVLSLLHSHISQFSTPEPRLVWSRIVDTVHIWNQSAGTITLENLPEEIKAFFQERKVSHFPTSLVKPKTSVEPIDWSQHQHATALAVASLIGCWDEQKPTDVEVVSALVGENYNDWIQKPKSWLTLTDAPVAIKNGVWTVQRRIELLQALGNKLFDQNLDAFKQNAVSVLRESDPSFELATDQRIMASIYGKVPSHSQILRKGFAEGLALLGACPEWLTHCSLNKAEVTVALAIREIFADADWRLWGSLNHLLPTLAEAAPKEFLRAVENALNQTPCPFDELFAQEGDGMFGGNYLSGLLWALETLAWDEAYLVSACSLLGELAGHDPGGKWANHPANSLSTILLPWLPQTVAPFEKRQAVIRTLKNDQPDVAWSLILNLLPNQLQSSFGAHKPVWRNVIPATWEKGVTQQEYWEQISFYAEQAVEMAGYDPIRLGDLVERFDSLPNPAYDQLLSVLRSETVVSLGEDVRQKLWEKLVGFVAKHRRFPNAEWSMDEALLAPIDAVAEKLAPLTPFIRYQHLFSNRDFEQYDDEISWDEKLKKLNQRRIDAAKDLLDQNGITTLIWFAEAVKSPNQVGQALAHIADDKIDEFLLPEYLSKENVQLDNFISAYIGTRLHISGWPWADGFDMTTWNKSQIAQFFSQLPFEQRTWQRVAQHLRDCEIKYWQHAWVNPYQPDSDLAFAVDKLIKYGRPLAAIDCLDMMRHGQKSLDVDQCVRALMAAVSTSEPTHTLASHHIVDLIKYLQESIDVSPDDLFRVEWAYLPLLNGYHGARPIYLEKRLADDPDFFCEAIRLIYRSDKQGTETEEVSEQRKSLANNAYRLLNDWKTPPGTEADGTFNSEKLVVWINRVRELAEESGHSDVAMSSVGHVLMHCPPDADGLWMNRGAAEQLNEKYAEALRRGYYFAIRNSRGVYTVDPSGASELKLAEKYRLQAAEMEHEGYVRFAQTLNTLADSYETDAARVRDEYEKD